MSFSYSTTYLLDKSHFSETFDESVTPSDPKTAYLKAIGLIAFGLTILIFSRISAYAGWFVIVIGIVEALSVVYKKPWWLARQMISRAANENLSLTIDDEGISVESEFVNSQLLWTDISHFESTKRGWLLHHNMGKSYISLRCLSQEANAYIHARKNDNSELEVS